jgi:hypothetical protein
MGYTGWSDDTYDSLSRSHSTKTADEIFNDAESEEMSAIEIDIRESRDSDEHPESLAVMVFLDVTASMGRIPEIIVKEKLGALMNTIINNGIEHPQIFFGAIGDHHTDRSPIQIGQFESGTEELDKWLTSIFIEGGGGGQNMESYLLAWLLAGKHTSIDCFEKRNVKGFLFTIGDEKSWDSLDASVLKKFLGYPQGETLTDKQLLEEAQRMYNVYHIHVNEGSYCNDSNILDYWKEMLGERLIILDDYQVICETIATVIAMQNGVDMKNVVNAFDDNTKALVSTALAHISTTVIAKDDEGVTEL